MAAWRYEISLLVLKKYFTSERSERLKYSSTLEEKFRISARPCNILYLWYLLKTSSKYTITDCVALQKDIRWMYWYLREARVGKGKMNNFAVMYYVTILKLIWNIVNLTNWTKIENSTITTLKIFFAKNKYQIRSSLYFLKTVDCCIKLSIKASDRAKKLCFWKIWVVEVVLHQIVLSAI